MSERNPVEGNIRGNFTAKEIELNEQDRDRNSDSDQVIEYRRGVGRVRRQRGKS